MYQPLLRCRICSYKKYKSQTQSGQAFKVDMTLKCANRGHPPASQQSGACHAHLHEGLNRRFAPYSAACR